MVQKKIQILAVDDDADMRELLSDYYTPRGFQVETFANPQEAIARTKERLAEGNPVDLVLTDLMMPTMDGLTFTERMHEIAEDLPILVMTAHSSVDAAIDAIRRGAYDFVVKPLDFQQLNLSIERAVRLRRIQNENSELRAHLTKDAAIPGIIGRSQSMLQVCDLVNRVAGSSATVLINGESGTGKEVIARAIHNLSPRKKQKFIALNCSAIPEHLLESELFGHAKGSFTGASDKKVGLFEEANEGTLFLDEIGDMPLLLQAKLLRVIQERTLRRVGENQDRPIDVRVLAATHKNLMEAVREGRFREDLYFRLNVIPIRVPPLRERREDILPLAQHFLKKILLREGQVGSKTLSKDAIDHLTRLDWPGNVRELENTIERAVILSRGSEIVGTDLPEPMASRPTEVAVASATGFGASAYSTGAQGFVVPANSTLPSLEELTNRYVSFVLEAVGGVKEKAARILDVDRKTLYRKIQKASGLEETETPSSL